MKKLFELSSSNSSPRPERVPSRRSGGGSVMRHRWGDVLSRSHAGPTGQGTQQIRPHAVGFAGSSYSQATGRNNGGGHGVAMVAMPAVRWATPLGMVKGGRVRSRVDRGFASRS